MVVYGDAEVVHLTFTLQLRDSRQPASIPDPLILRHVQLLHGQSLDAEVF